MLTQGALTIAEIADASTPEEIVAWTLRRFAGDELRAINEKIASNGVLEEDIEGLKPGMNLIRFVARTELGGGWITNTVAIQRL